MARRALHRARTQLGLADDADCDICTTPRKHPLQDGRSLLEGVDAGTVSSRYFTRAFLVPQLHLAAPAEVLRRPGKGLDVSFGPFVCRLQNDCISLAPDEH